MAGHRERLLEGMVAAVSRHGYAGASVARVIEAAGVSRATFYEHFSGRDECFLAAYRATVRQVGARIGEASGSAPTSARPRAVVAALLAAVAEDAGAARLALIEALASGPAVRDEHDALIVAAEAAIERSLDEAAGTDWALLIPASALLGGVAGPLSTRVFAGEAATVPCLLEDLLTWVDSYGVGSRAPHLDSAAWRELGRGLPAPPPEPSVSKTLPRGRRALPPPLAAKARRERIIESTARLSAAKGYRGLTVAGIAAAARVSRGAFYSHFPSKEEAFLATQTAGLRGSIADAAAEFSAASTWPQQVWNAQRALLAYVARHPHQAHAATVEVFAAGRAAVRRSHDSQMAFVLFLEEGYRQREEAEGLPRLCSEAIAGAIFNLMRRQVLRGRATEMLEILPQAAYVTLAPFLGPVAAFDFVRQQAEAAR